jgi:reductive dehalogenase
MSRQIKKVARFLGASLVGICELDRRWIYSHTFHMLTREHAEFDIPEDYKYAIALAVEMDYELMKTSPTCLEGAATGVGYSEMAYVAGLLAEFIRGLGYKAIPSGNDTALSIPIAIDAGLGELGRHGILITEEYGPRVRLCKVLTDMPLAPDKIHEFGAAEFCESCKKCAKFCPGQAISSGERTDRPNNISNNSGVMKWPVDAEKCFGFWARNGSSCATCIRVCPFNKPRGWLHSTVRWGVKHAPWANSLFIWGDDFFGYGKRADPAKFWEE